MTIVRSTKRRPPTGFEVFRLRNSDFVEALPQLRRYRDNALSRLQQLQQCEQRNKVRAILSDRRLLQLYAYEALRKKGKLHSATVDTINDLANEANLFNICEEPHTSHMVRSRSRRRFVYSFGLQKRLRQMLVADVIHSLHPPLDSQYLFRGGMPAARRAVDAAFFEHGFSHCVEIDFVNFYGSIPSEGLAEVLKPLPRAVVQHVVYDTAIRQNDHDAIHVYNRTNIRVTVSASISWSDPHRIGPTGLSLGSACSPIVGECVLAQFLREIPDNQYVSYADNILLFGNSDHEVQVLTESLRRRMQSGDGPMRYRTEQIFRDGGRTEMQRGFRFLGQDATVPHSTGETHQSFSGFKWSPSAEKQSEYHVTELDTGLKDAELNEAERKVIHWRLAYPEWENGEEFEAHRLAEIASLRYFRAPNALNQRRAADAVISAMLASQLRFGAFFIIPENNNSSNDRIRNSLVQLCENRIAVLYTHEPHLT